MSSCSFHDDIADVALGTPLSTALGAHLRECDDCAAELERQRALAARIDAVIKTVVRAQPADRLLPNTIASITNANQPRRRIVIWPQAVFGAVAAAAAVAVVIGLHPSSPTAPLAANAGALTAWRSPTTALLQTHDSVQRAPIRDVWFDPEPRPFRSHRPHGDTYGA